VRLTTSSAKKGMVHQSGITLAERSTVPPIMKRPVLCVVETDNVDSKFNDSRSTGNSP
jgi:hypothetical protein